VDVLARFNETVVESETSMALIEMTREFKNVLKDVRRRHELELEQFKQTAVPEPEVDSEVMCTVQKVCSENSVLSGKCRGLQDQIMVLERYRADNTQLRDSLAKAGDINAELGKKVWQNLLKLG
jgi:hypothetical protein